MIYICRGFAEYVDLIPGLRGSLGRGNGNPLQYSFLENPIDRGAQQATVHGSQRVKTQLSTCAHKQ